MKKLFLLSCFFLAGYFIHAQNLVPNGSFEDTISCPTFPGQVWRAAGWYIAENSPDYFNECCNNTFPSVGVPLNDWGNRNAATGYAYCGMWCYASTTLYREKVGIQLLQPLVYGTRYYLSFKVSSSYGYVIGANGACSKTGMLFSTVKFDLFNLPPTNNFSQFYTDSIVTDTTGWVLLKGSFIADSSYRYLTIGNFFDNTHTDTIGYSHQQGNHNIVAYYYVDDICVTTDSSGCRFEDGIITPIATTLFFIYPNPANDAINIQLNSVTANSISLYNSVGQTLYVDNHTIRKGSTQINTEQFPEGIYFLQIKTKEKLITEKISIIH